MIAEVNLLFLEVVIFSLVYEFRFARFIPNNKPSLRGTGLAYQFKGGVTNTHLKFRS